MASEMPQKRRKVLETKRLVEPSKYLGKLKIAAEPGTPNRDMAGKR
jgi:hypothetical protein